MCISWKKDNMGWSGWEEFGNLTTDDKTAVQHKSWVNFEFSTNSLD
jgi:hypothetical protein